MNIALLGYGKMGKLIEQIAIKRQHKIIAIKDIDRPEIDFTNVSMGIDFSTPEAAYENIVGCLENGIPVISGTTGWLDKYDEVEELCKVKEGTFLYASNFSLGVNIFFALNSYLAKLMNPLNQYEVSLEEIHHIHKLDAPSGTAISLAEDCGSLTNSEIFKTVRGIVGRSSMPAMIFCRSGLLIFALVILAFSRQLLAGRIEYLNHHRIIQYIAKLFFQFLFD